MAEYADRSARDLEPHYSKHVRAMTAEGLHEKAAIAAELAFRDAEIEELRGLLLEAKEPLAEAAYVIGLLREHLPQMCDALQAHRLENAEARTDRWLKERDIMIAALQPISKYRGDRLTLIWNVHSQLWYLGQPGHSCNSSEIQVAWIGTDGEVHITRDVLINHVGGG